MPHKIHALGDDVYFHFGSNDTSGSGDDGANPVFDVRLCGAAAGAIPVLSGNATLLTHANYPDGSHEVAVAATAPNGFAADNEYAIFCTLLVDGENPTGLVGSFRLVASGAVLDSVPQIVSDGNAFLGASIAAILADVTGIGGVAMRGTDNAALAAVWTPALAGLLAPPFTASVVAWAFNTEQIFRTDLPAEDSYFYQYALCLFTSGNLTGQFRAVEISVTAAGPTTQFGIAGGIGFTEVPGAGDDFVLWPAAAILPGDEMDLVDAPNATALTAMAAAVWDYATALCTTVGSIGLMIVDYLGVFVALAPVADGEDTVREDFDKLPFRRDITVIQARTWEESFVVSICLHGGAAELIDFTEATAGTIRFRASDGTVTAEIALHEMAAGGHITARLTIGQTAALEAGRQRWEIFLDFPPGSTQFPDGEEFSLFAGTAVVHAGIPAI